jgi:hypothetical protein
MSEICIVNYAEGSWYPRGQARLYRSLLDVGFPQLGDFHAFNARSLPCRPHSEVPYGFKVAAFNYAAQHGYRLVLWCDASIWAIRPLDGIFAHIEKTGHVLFTGGWNCAQWTSDACLQQMGVTRDESEKMPQYSACVMGLDLSQSRSAEFLQRLNAYAWCQPSCFLGDWRNDHQQVSRDPRCLGHRHDQSVGSIIACQLGMEHVIAQDTFFQYYNNAARVPYRYGEANDMSSVPENVLLLNQGM